jgi:hypothetical protein
MTLGSAAAAGVRLIVWAGIVATRSSPIPPRSAAPAPSMLDWRERLVCSQCGSRKVDMVVTGTERR